MEQLEHQPISIQEYRDRLKKKTCNIQELSEILGVSKDKARRITHIEGFPCIKIGRDIRIILSKLDDFLENHIGEVL
jgi:excisionase family DNA binding protein